MEGKKKKEEEEGKDFLGPPSLFSLTASRGAEFLISKEGERGKRSFWRRERERRNLKGGLERGKRKCCRSTDEGHTQTDLDRGGGKELEKVGESGAVIRPSSSS